MRKLLVVGRKITIHIHSGRKHDTGIKLERAFKKGRQHLDPCHHLLWIGVRDRHISAVKELGLGDLSALQRLFELATDIGGHVGDKGNEFLVGGLSAKCDGALHKAF